MFTPSVPASPALSVTRPAASYARASLAPATLRAYQAGWQAFCEWCALAGRSALPAAPETVAAYLAALARTHAPATLRRRLAALSRAQRQAGHRFWPSHPAIRETLRGIGRDHGAPQRRAAALATPEVRRLVAACGDDTAGLRDRALLLLGYAGALRRSEIVGIDREHLAFDTEGLRLTLPRSKGDQAAQGTALGIPRGQHRAT
jgi:site-specific recombinase XerD